jgi:hypothetical protein
MSDEQLVIVAIPPLVAILLNREHEKGGPLTESEVLSIRDGAVCMAMPYDVAAKVAAKRGYDDIRLECAWEDWNAVRPSLGL